MVQILYEDNHLLAAFKPPALLTQPSGQEDTDSLEKRCKEMVKKRDGKEGNVFLHAIHRLDKPVGGIVLFAKSRKALERLNEVMRVGGIKKEYRATVEGALPHREGTLIHYLEKRDHRAVASSKGKEALLHYSAVQLSEGRYQLEIVLVTGRYHQIRAQLALVGAPILGDIKYGSKEPQAEGSIALEHFRMTFPHPVTKEIITLELP